MARAAHRPVVRCHRHAGGAHLLEPLRPPVHLRQGKRLFSLVSTGEVVAGILGGFSISLLAPIVGTDRLLVVVVVAFVLCVLLFWEIVKHYQHRIARTDEASEFDEEEADSGALPTPKNEGINWRSRYMVLLAALAGLSLFGYYFVDFLFYQLAEERYPNEDALTSFLGLFFAAVGVVNLIFKGVLAGKLLNRFGMTFGLLFLPTMILLGGLAAIAAGLVDPETLLFFLLIAGIKLLDGVARSSVDEPAVILLYQPLPVRFRLAAQARIESIGEPAAAILAGLFMLLITTQWEVEPLHLVYLLLAVVAGWLAVGNLLRREYWVMLDSALSKRTLGEGVHLALDTHILTILSERLDSPHIGEVLYLLDLLEQERHELLEDALRRLLARPEPEIRLDALRRIERLGLSSLEPLVKELNELEDDPQVLGAGIRTYTAITASDLVEEVVPYLDHPNQTVRKNALVGLLRSGGIEGVLIAGERFFSMVQAQDPRQRVLAAEVLGEVGIRNFYRPLTPLLKDPYRQVRQAAFLAAGKLGNPRLWPTIVASLPIKSLRRSAEQALATGGPSTLAELRRVYQQTELGREIRFSILRICTINCQPAMTELLLTAVIDPDQPLRHQALRALNRCRFQSNREEVRSRLLRAVEMEIEQAIWALTTIHYLQLSRAFPLLIKDLRGKLRLIRERLFLLLALLFNRKEIKQLEKNYDSGDREKRAYALEVLHKLLERHHLEKVLILFDDLPDHDRLQRLLGSPPPVMSDVESRLQEIISGRLEGVSFWTQSTAIYEVGKHGYQLYYPVVAGALRSPEKMVRETAGWAISRLRPEEAPRILTVLLKDKDPNVRAVGHYLETHPLKPAGPASAPASH
jgi:ATP:ADP antiporter, AAA family